MSEVRLLFVRHGEVASHHGDVPVTEAGLVHAERTGKAIGAAAEGPFSVLFGGTRRTRETAEAIVRGIGTPEQVKGPIDAFALRNPDVYLAGARVNMGSTAEFLAEQVAGMTVDQVKSNEWWSGFLAAPDRIGWWLSHAAPPGESGGDVARRIQQFARSFADQGPHSGRLVVCVTHSPLLRSMLKEATGTDPGEPAYVTGLSVRVGPSGGLDIEPHDPINP